MNKPHTPKDLLEGMLRGEPPKAELVIPVPIEEKPQLENSGISEAPPKPASSSVKPTPGRKSPQICCKVTEEAYGFLTKLTVRTTNELGKSVNMTSVIRSVIELAIEHENELKFKAD